jgi:hypothetical protein
MNQTELDVGGYHHKVIWDNLAVQFNKNTGVSEDGDAEENAYLDVIQSPHHLYNSKNPEEIDQLDGQDFAQPIHPLDQASILRGPQIGLWQSRKI